jgi:membrane protease YdiL (CAAX protease family)
MRPFPNIPQTIGLLALVFAIQIGLAIPVALIAFASGTTRIFENPLTVAFFNTVSIGLVLLIGLKLAKVTFREVFPFKPIRFIWLIPMAFTVIGMGILLSEVDNLLRIFLPIPEWLEKALQSFFGGSQNVFSSFFTLVVVAAVTEELLFRGLILRGFLQNYSVHKAIAVSALLFGAFHLNPWQFTGAVVLGGVFAWWFVKTRSLLPCLFGHALNNGLPLLALAIPQLKDLGFVSDGTGPVKFQPLWFDSLGLFLAAIGLWWTAREFSKTPTPFTAAVDAAEISPNGNAHRENLNAI